MTLWLCSVCVCFLAAQQAANSEPWFMGLPQAPKELCKLRRGSSDTVIASVQARAPRGSACEAACNDENKCSVPIIFQLECTRGEERVVSCTGDNFKVSQPPSKKTESTKQSGLQCGDAAPSLYPEGGKYVDVKVCYRFPMAKVDTELDFLCSAKTGALIHCD